MSKTETGIEIRLNKAQRQIGVAAAGEDSRPVLTHVMLKKGVMVAADGFMLAQTSVGYDGDEPILLNAADLLKSKDIKHTNDICVTVGKETAQMVGKDTLISKLGSGDFPNYEALYPKGEVSFQIALNTDILTKVAKMGGKGAIVRFTFRDQSGPTEIEIKQPYDDETIMKGLLMPMFVDWSKSPAKYNCNVTYTYGDGDVIDKVGTLLCYVRAESEEQAQEFARLKAMDILGVSKERITGATVKLRS
jgi:hypothetical protein